MEKAVIKLREELRKYRGSVKRIAEYTETTDVWVMRVLSGKVHNERVIKTAMKVLEEMRKEKEEAEAKKAQYFMALDAEIMEAVA